MEKFVVQHLSVGVCGKIGDREQVKRTSLPPTVVEGSSAGGRCCPTPVGIGSPDDGVAILLDVLVLNVRTSWQRNGRCVPMFHQKSAQTNVQTLTTPVRVIRRREGDCFVWGPVAEFLNRSNEENILWKDLKFELFTQPDPFYGERFLSPPKTVLA